MEQVNVDHLLRVDNYRNVNQVQNTQVDSVACDEDGIRHKLLELARPVYVIHTNGQVGLSHQGSFSGGNTSGAEALFSTAALSVEQLGDPSFCADYGVRCALYAGAMAHGIASVEMVTALGKAGLLGSFGAAGMVGPHLEDAIRRVQAELPDGPYAFNLIHSHVEEAMEVAAVDLFLKYGVCVVEASAFLDLTASVVYYRAAGLSRSADGKVRIGNRIIAKLSRAEVARKFMSPAPEKMLAELASAGLITPEQVELARRVPVADDVTVEADSGGHTDNRPLVSLIPTMLALRDEIQAQYQYDRPVRVGAGGGISTPSAALAAFMMGAAYVVTGSVNQACVEAGASEHTRKLLAKAGMADVMMAPSADMFEMGVKVQVLKSGTLFPMRAQKLYDLYTRYDSIEAIPTDEREKLERQVFRRSLDSVWADTVKFFKERDPDQIARAEDNPKRKMALIFRWYLGLSSRWSNSGEVGREMDYQIWCGPSMGSFNDWVRGTYLAEYQNRRVVDANLQILTGAAYLYRLQSLKLQGLQASSRLEAYVPEQALA